MTAFQISTIHILRAAKLLQRQKKKPKSSSELKQPNTTPHKPVKQTKPQKKNPKLSPPNNTKFDPFIIIYKFLEVRFQEISSHLRKVKKKSWSNFVAESTPITNKT